jgi:AraC-like DNA-binding protein
MKSSQPSSTVDSLCPGGRLSTFVSAMGALRTGGDFRVEHLALPIDLFMVTAHHSDESDELDVSIMSLRTRAQRFRSREAGQLSFALLTPRGLMMLLGKPLLGRTDTRISLDEFCSRDERQRLRDQLLRSRQWNDRMLHFAHWLEERIDQRRRFSTQESRVAHASELLQLDRGAPVAWPGLCETVGTSKRQLERDFRRWLGVSPSGFDRLVRFQRVAQAMVAGERLVDATHDHHFYDQAHMSRTCKAMSSLTPRELTIAAARPERRKEQQALSGRILVVESGSLSLATSEGEIA